MAESLLALAFGDVDALGSCCILRDGGEERFDEFEGWTLVDLLGERFSDIARPALRFEIASQIERCGGDPVQLLYVASRDLSQVSASTWNQRFPLSIFAGVVPISRSIQFDIADAHLHSGASVPLGLFFDALASGSAPVDGKSLADKTIRSATGTEWDLHTIVAATRWAFRLVRYLRDGGGLEEVANLTERGFDHRVVERVKDGTFWVGVKTEAVNTSERPLLALMSRTFEYDGLSSIGDVFWRVARLSKYSFDARRAFVTGLIRACVAVASLVSARPGDGLTRFVDRFEEMGLARDASLGDMKSELTRSTLDYMAASNDVVGAEFRKTIVAKSRQDFKRKLLAALAAHHRGFGTFVENDGRAMALSMPVGFLRRPCTVSEWTDLQQLRDGLVGYNALRLALVKDDGTLTAAISTIDVAGDEHGSSSWPFAAVAELLRRNTIDLGYAIHAGESFYSQLNGIRRVGELFLADRVPDRIGHALALAESAATAICQGTAASPVRIGDAICDLAWALTAGCGDPSAAKDLLYQLVKGPGGKALDPDAWVDAYSVLFSTDDLIRHGVIYETAGAFKACDLETLHRLGRAGGAVERAVCALTCGAASVAHVDVKAPVPNPLLPALHAFGAATAQAAREHVLALVKEHDVAIEACPTSNVRLANLQGFSAHPMWSWRNAGVTVVVGSDDPLIFGSTIADEFVEMLSVQSDTVVRGIASATVKRCSRERRRRLSEFRTIAELADRAAG